jgi:hypothetical protein
VLLITDVGIIPKLEKNEVYKTNGKRWLSVMVGGWGGGRGETEKETMVVSA